MKTLLIALLLISSLSHAEWQLESKVSKVAMDWGDKGSFNFTLNQVGGSYLFKTGIGFSALAGQSDTQSEQVATVKLRDFWVISAFYDVKVTNNISVVPSFTYTEYKEVVNGEPKSDTGTGYGLAIQYKINSKYAVKASMNDYYGKKSDWCGYEDTKGFGLSLVARF